MKRDDVIDAAKKAGQLIQSNVNFKRRPHEAWKEAIRQLKVEENKPCPRAMFFALCAKGFVAGVEKGYRVPDEELDVIVGLKVRGFYVKNLEMAKPAVEALKRNGELTAPELWKLIRRRENETHNGESHVVLALWEAGFIVGSGA